MRRWVARLLIDSPQNVFLSIDPLPVEDMYRCTNQGAIDAAKRAGKTGVAVPLPTYQSCRGSNKVESRHKLTNRLLSNRCNMNPDLAGLILSEFDFRRNLAAGIKYGGDQDTGIIRLERLEGLSQLCKEQKWPDVTAEMGYRPLGRDYATAEAFYFDHISAPGPSTTTITSAAISGTASRFLPASSSVVVPPTRDDEYDSDDDDGPGGDEAEILLRERYDIIERGADDDDDVGNAPPVPQLSPGAGPSAALGPAATAAPPIAAGSAGAPLPSPPPLSPPPVAPRPVVPAASAAVRASLALRKQNAPFTGDVPASMAAMASLSAGGPAGRGLSPAPSLPGSMSSLSTTRQAVLSSGVGPPTLTPAQMVAAAARGAAALPSGTRAWHPSRRLLWSQMSRPVQTPAEITLFLDLVTRFHSDWVAFAKEWNAEYLKRLASDASLNPDVKSQVYLKTPAHLKDYHDAIMRQEALRMALTPRPRKSAAGPESTAAGSGGGPGPSAAAGSGLTGGADAAHPSAVSAGPSAAAMGSGLPGGASAAGPSSVAAGSGLPAGAASAGFGGAAWGPGQSASQLYPFAPPSVLRGAPPAAGLLSATGPSSDVAGSGHSGGAGAAGPSLSAAASAGWGHFGGVGQSTSQLHAFAPSTVLGGAPPPAGFPNAAVAAAAAAAAAARSERKRKMAGGASAASMLLPAAASAFASAPLQPAQISPAEASRGAPSASQGARRGGVGKIKYCKMCNWAISGANAAGFFHGNGKSEGAEGASSNHRPYCRMVMASGRLFRLPCAKCLGEVCTLHEGVGLCCSRRPSEMEALGYTFERIREWAGFVPE